MMGCMFPTSPNRTCIQSRFSLFLKSWRWTLWRTKKFSSSALVRIRAFYRSRRPAAEDTPPERQVFTFPVEVLDERDPSATLKKAKRISGHTSFIKVGRCRGRTLVSIVKASQLPTVNDDQDIGADRPGCSSNAHTPKTVAGRYQRFSQNLQGKSGAQFSCRAVR
ncbi:hypothetical protein FA13DRAFT_193514 [Coprinellus micaceus]|uniref:Uncharacterized protein n=1 Tax=Coprinellus micaceus TaxID=71717 RepID=A0A4Y7TG87_COPMI|nr:hypothetical protein FA13DRAFT_193514 [Coprinellus micaceus]